MSNPKRHILKAVTYRILAFGATFTVAYLFLDGNIKIASGFTVFDSILKFILYYIHERAWDGR